MGLSFFKNPGKTCFFCAFVHVDIKNDYKTYMFTCLHVLCTHILAGNVGVVSRIFSYQNDRHADMAALCCRHDTDHVGNIALCRLVGRRVSVVLAWRFANMFAHVGKKLPHVLLKTYQFHRWFVSLCSSTSHLPSVFRPLSNLCTKILSRSGTLCFITALVLR